MCPIVINIVAPIKNRMMALFSVMSICSIIIRRLISDPSRTITDQMTVKKIFALHLGKYIRRLAGRKLPYLSLIHI